MRTSQYPHPHLNQDWLDFSERLQLSDTQKSKLNDLLKPRPEHERIPLFYAYYELYKILDEKQLEIFRKILPGEADWSDFMLKYIQDDKLRNSIFKKYLKLESVLYDKSLSPKQKIIADKYFVLEIEKELKSTGMKKIAEALRKKYKQYFPKTKCSNEKIGIYSYKRKLSLRAQPQNRLDQKIDTYIINACREYIQSLPKPLIGKLAQNVYSKKPGKGSNHLAYSLVIAYDQTLAADIFNTLAASNTDPTLVTAIGENKIRQAFAETLHQRLTDIAALKGISTARIQPILENSELQEPSGVNWLSPRQKSTTTIGSIVITSQTIHTVCKYVDALYKQCYQGPGLLVAQPVNKEGYSEGTSADSSHSPIEDLLAAANELDHKDKLGNSHKNAGNAPSTDTVLAHPLQPSPSQEMELGNATLPASPAPRASYPGPSLFSNVNTTAKLKKLSEVRRKRKAAEKRLNTVKHQKIGSISELHKEVDKLRNSLDSKANSIAKTNPSASINYHRSDLKSLEQQLNYEKNELIALLKNEIKDICSEMLKTRSAIDYYRDALEMQPTSKLSEMSIPTILSNDNVEQLTACHHDVLARAASSKSVLTELMKKADEMIFEEEALQKNIKEELGSDDDIDTSSDDNYSSHRMS